jgi:hypothetical protein
MLGAPMTILRMSVFVLSLSLCASAYSQTGSQSTYQCSSGTSLKAGYLTYKTGHILAVAKHKDGTISEISGMMGNLQQIINHPDSNTALQPQYVASMEQISTSVNQFVANPAQPYLQPFQGGLMNSGGLGPGMISRTGVGMGMPVGMGMTGGMSGQTTEEAPDRTDIQSARTRYVEQTAGDKAGKISSVGAYIKIGTRPGDTAGTNSRPGDPVNSMPLRKSVEPKNGELVMKDDTTSYSARLDSQGNISEISFRIGKKSADKWRANSTNSADAQTVYTNLNGEIKDIKSRAYCCTKNPGAICGVNLDQTGAQYSLLSEKPSVGQKLQNAWSDLINAFRSNSSNEAK